MRDPSDIVLSIHRLRPKVLHLSAREYREMEWWAGRNGRTEKRDESGRLVIAGVPVVPRVSRTARPRF